MTGIRELTRSRDGYRWIRLRNFRGQNENPFYDGDRKRTLYTVHII